MIKVVVKDLVGNEILERHIVSESGIELIAQGTRLKKEYIEKLTELGIESVYIKDEVSEDLILDNTQNRRQEVEKMRLETTSLVKTIIEKHIYTRAGELEPVCQVAQIIIDEIIQDENIGNELLEIKNDSFDIFTHSINVCMLSVMLALRNTQNKDTLCNIAKGAILHDIGLRYITIDYEDTDLDNGSVKEKIEYRKHVIYGYDAIKDAKWLPDISKEIILSHHERINSTGYPFKSSNERIKKEVKMVAVCDAFERMISGIGCRRTKIHEAVAYMKVNAGISLERIYVEQLLKFIAVYPVDTIVKLSSGEICKVVSQNVEFTDRPKLKVIKDKDGNVVENAYTIDLMKQLDIVVNSVIN